MLSKRVTLMLACLLGVFFLSMVIEKRSENDHLEEIVNEDSSHYHQGHEVRSKSNPSDDLSTKKQKRTLNVLLPDPKFDTVLEGYFMKNILLGALDRPVEFHELQDFDAKDRTTWKIMNDSMVFTFFRNAFNTNSDEYFDWIKSQKHGINIGVFHMADEVHKASIKHYSQADYVIRNYYFEDIFDTYPDKVMWVPNGYASGVGPRDIHSLPVASKREINCHFAGRKTAERTAFMETLERVAPGVCVLETTKSFGKGLPKEAYGDQLSNTIIAPCPTGNAVETIRFYDALECGAIPVVTKSTYSKMLLAEARKDEPGNSNAKDWHDEDPFIVLEDWDTFNDVVTPLLHDKPRLDRIQKRTIHWWKSYKEKKARQIAKMVDRSFRKYYGEDA